MLRSLLVLFLMFSIMPLSVSADKLKITRLTDGAVSVGGRSLKPGDVFDDSETIKWSKPTQQMEAKNTVTGAIYHFSARQFASKNGVATIKDFFMRINKASTRKAEGADLVFTVSPVSGNFPEKRIALVIANTNYTNISSLRNPMYDAEEIGRAHV